MIRIPIIDRILGINTVNNKASRKLNAMAKDIATMSKDPKWIAFLEKERSKETKIQE